MNSATTSFHIKSDKLSALNQSVYLYVQDRIISLDFKPGEKLNMVQLAETLDVSRTPIKAAIDVLVEDGLVVSGSAKSYYVAPLNFTDCLNLSDTRKIIEGTAAYIAADSRTEKDLEAMERNLELAKKHYDEKDYVAFAKTDMEFHECVLAASHNPFLLQAYYTIRVRMQRYRYIVAEYCRKDAPKDTTKAFLKHRCIYKAIKSNYASVARSEMEEHIDYSYRNLFSLGRLSLEDSESLH